MTVGARGVARYGSGRVVGADFAERKGCQHISGSAPVTITSSSSSPAAASGARIWRLTVTSSTSGSACIAGASSSLLSSSSTTSMSTMARARTRNSGRAANSDGNRSANPRRVRKFGKRVFITTDPDNTGKKSKKAIYLSSRSARLLSVDRRARARRGDKLVSEGEAAETYVMRDRGGGGRRRRVLLLSIVSVRYKKVEPRAATPDPRTELRDVRQSANALSKPSLETAYFSFFLMRSWFVCPHFFLRQFTARAWRRA